MKKILFTLFVLISSQSATAATMQFDFGRTDMQSGLGWNNIVPATTNLLVIVDSSGNVIPGVGLEVTDPFFTNGEPSSLGSESPAGDAAGYPVSATDDYLFGHTGPFAGAASNPTGGVRLTGLDQNELYDFTFFTSRQTVGDIRDAEYNVFGLNSGSGVLNASNNDSEILEILGITPDPRGSILITAQAGPDNNNSNGFYYLGLMSVDGSPGEVPIPAAAWLFSSGLIGLTGVARRRIK